MDTMEEEEDYIPIRKRRKLEECRVLSRRRNESLGKEASPVDSNPNNFNAAAKPSLFEVASAQPLQQKHDDNLDDAVMLGELSSALVPVAERARGVKYTTPMQTGWTPPKKFQQMSKNDLDVIRKKWRSNSIDVQGDDVPPPLASFAEMRFQKSILSKLKEKSIKKPTPIQVQGLPVALSGRDMIGIAFTGSGKTLTFVLPLLMLAMQEEENKPFLSGEGPFGLILCPTHELARQTYKQIEDFTSVCNVQLRSMLCIGDHDMRQDLQVLRRKGLHIVVATLGRLLSLLESKVLKLDRCKYVTLDEADKLLSWTETKKVFDFFKFQRQTLLFSATMPKILQDFSREALVQPVVVNVAGRAGAANLDVIQEVEYVKEPAKLKYLLECIQKTAPPVLIFCNSSVSVDLVYEMLLSVGAFITVEAVHGQRGREERELAISKFREGKCDILVATDVASKGLDFPGVEHVINFDMPREISDYVHRIGRTGRSGGRHMLFILFYNN